MSRTYNAPIVYLVFEQETLQHSNRLVAAASSEEHARDIASPGGRSSALRTWARHPVIAPAYADAVVAVVRGEPGAPYDNPTVLRVFATRHDATDYLLRRDRGMDDVGAVRLIVDMPPRDRKAS